MVFLGPHFWDIVSDCLQIVLSLLILFFFVRNRINQKRPVRSETIRDMGKSFNEHVLTQKLQQQLDLVFTNIEENLTVERSKLERVLGIKHGDFEDAGISKVPSNPRMPKNSGGRRYSDETAGDERRNEKIRKYSDRGLSARRISDQLRIPISEVELILSLEQK